MKLLTLHLYPLITFVSLLGTFAIPAHSQPITPATDGTGTKVNQNGNQFNIQGGTRSLNGANLFHSFSQFNVKFSQTANFLTTPDIRNILGRVTGGDASVINGLIQVVGGNSNLFLMNPAGIIFGPNASLNVPASFSVTTATGIGFNSNNFWFQAMGTNDYANLVGNPSGYHFDVSNPGAIVNEGNLSLNPGENLTLLGGTVINTGQLSTAGGNITIAAVNGGDRLRISQPGHLLSLDIPSSSANLSGQSITPLSLPQLLTGSPLSNEGGYNNHASSVIVDAQGNLALTNTTGVTVASGNIDVSTTSTSPLSKGGQGGYNSGQINILGDRVAVIDANIQANGINGGGKILIGGDFQGNGIVPNSQQTFVNNNSFISADAINNGNGGRVIIWSDDTTNFAGNISAIGGEFSGDGGFVEISGKQQLIFDGNVNVSSIYGEIGTILFDPKNIIIGVETSPPFQRGVRGDNEEDNQTFSAEEIQDLEGEIILQADNDITVNQGIETSDSIELIAGRSININADINTSENNGNISLFGNDNSANFDNREPGAASINQTEGTTLNAGSGNITIRLGNLGANGDINLANLTTTGQILVNANQGNIRQVSPNSLITADRAIFETQDSGGIGLAETPLRIDVNNLEVLTGEQGLFIESISNLTIGGVSEELTGIDTRRGGNIELNINGNLTANEGILTSAPDRQPGNITISSSGNIDTTQTTLKANSESTSGGDVFLSADGDIKTGVIDVSTGGNNRGGNITINSGREVDTTAGEIFSASFEGDGGNVTITSNNDLKTGYIDSRSDGSGNGGNITLESTGGNVDTSREELASFSVGGNAGNVSITSNGDIKTADIFSSAGEPLDAGGDLEGSSPFETNNTDSNETASGKGGDITLTAEGTIDTSAGELESFSRLGEGGSVNITSKGNITTGEIFSTAGEPNTDNGTNNNNTTETTETEVNQSNSGNINIESTEGAVNTRGEISTFATGGSAGDITIKAFGNIETQSVDSRTGGGDGGDITIESTNGNITTGGDLASLSQLGNAGSVSITSDGNLTTKDIDSNSQNGQGGNITLESTNGNIDTTLGNIFSSSVERRAGNVTITSNGDLTTANIDSNSENGQGGNITLESTNGNIDTTLGELASSSRNGNAGNVSIISEGGIKTRNISSFAGRALDEQEDSESVSSSQINNTDSIQNESGTGSGGDITLNAGGTIDTTAGNLESFSRNGDGGSVSIRSKGDITTGRLLSTAGDPQGGESNTNASQTETNGGSSGDITIESTAGSVNAQREINSFADVGDGGDVTIRSHGDISIDDEINSRSDRNGKGGNIVIESTTGGINIENRLSSKAEDGEGGAVTLNSQGDIQTADIESFSREGAAGHISITATGDITTSDIISSAGDPEDRPPLRNNGENATITQSQIGEAEGNPGGNITIQSIEGTVTSEGELVSYSNKGDGGHVTIISNGDINLADIDSRADNKGRGGEIFIESQTGTINTINGQLVSSSRTGDGGNVEIIGAGNIEVENIFSFSEGNGNGGDVNITGNSDVKTATIASFAEGRGQGGDIVIIADGAIDTSIGELSSVSELGAGGNVILNAKENITTGFIKSFSFSGTRGGDITLETTNGNIDTTVGFLGEEANIPADADVSSQDVATIFAEESANLDSYAPEGTGGNIIIIQRGQGDITTSNISSFGGESSGAVNIINNDGNINTGVIFSTAINGTGGQISLETMNNGDLNINHIATYAATENGVGGDISLNASGIVNINNVASFGNAGSGDVSIESSSGSINTGKIQTRAPNGTSGNITLNTFSTEGDIRTANVSTEGGSAAGKVEIIAPDGSVTTQDLESSSESGSAGGIDVQAGEDIETGDQTVDSATGDANINNEAGGNITTGDQTAITGEGDASINNEAGGDITTGDQTAITGEGDASINNEAGGNITTGDQTAITGEGDATINNEAGGDITTGDQTAITGEGDAIINNEAGGNITTGDQTAITGEGNAIINNEAGGNITTEDQTAIGDTTNIINQPGGEINTGDIIEINPSPLIPIENLPQQIPITESPIANQRREIITSSPIANQRREIITSSPIANQRREIITSSPIANQRREIITSSPIANQRLNSVVTRIVESVQSNSSITTNNNPNLPNKQSDSQEINLNTDTTTALEKINIINSTPLTVAANSQTLANIEQNRNDEFAEYFEKDLSTQITSTQNIREVLSKIARQTGNNSAIIYVTAYPDELQLVLYTPEGEPILKTIPDADREQLMKVVLLLRAQITNPARRYTDSYLPASQKLYDWLIAPISAELEAANINTLLFSMDEGLRALPVAALHDGEQFLIEKYSLSLIPSVSLMDTNYRPLQDTQVLAMGASNFIEQNSLPAVPIELETISQKLWQGSQFLNQDFTRNNLLAQRQNYPYPIIHLATHAEFRPGKANNSYIQLWGDDQLKLDQIRELGWDKPAVELLVLSACRTAFGDKNAELGFAGLAVAAGVKSALASIWYVSDEGTLGLMTEFYTQLNNAKIKAEALRQAQLAMLRGEVVIAEGELRGTGARGAVVLPSALGKFENQNLSHPYYWAGFMMIGSPW